MGNIWLMQPLVEASALDQTLSGLIFVAFSLAAAIVASEKVKEVHNVWYFCTLSAGQLFASP